jgi:hypothetical protein
VIRLQPGGILADFEGSEGHYDCDQNSRHGRCDNEKTVRVELARNCISSAVRTRLMSEDGIAYARRKIAEGFAERAGTHCAEVKVRQAHLARIEQRIASPLLSAAPPASSR